MGTRPLALALLAASLAAPRAFADGAFPDELSVMLPESDPNRILVGTNFGLVVSPDAGASWRYVCEPFITGSVNDNVRFYNAASDGTVVAASSTGFWRTGDGGCSWTKATGSVANQVGVDVFIDPNDPLLVVAIAVDFAPGANGIHKSVDGGRTFTGPLYPAANRITGVEIAQSDPSVIYATEVLDGTSVAVQAFLLKSVDGGATWPTRRALNVPTGTQVSIAAVDPRVASKVYLRLLNFGTNTDGIALTANDGETLGVPFSIPGPTTFSAFLVAADGTLFAGTTSSDLYAAQPGTTNFVKRTGPRARCLGQRQGSPTAPIYACGDGFLDGYNLGVSDDSAGTFRTVMKFTDIAGPLSSCPAVAQGCAAHFAILQQTLGVAPPPGGTGGGASSPGTSKSGCGTAADGSAALAGALLTLAHLKLRRRR